LGVDGVGRSLLAIGLILVVLGGILVMLGRIPALRQLGRLPGDIVLHWGNGTVFIPLATSVILSVVLTLLINVIAALLR
jgi:hypothetical protein